MATRHLADLGARVIKVERPGTGDFARQYDETVNGLSSHFVWLNRSKESLTLNLKDPKAVEVMHRLLAEADVFVQNFAPGAIERIGLGAAEVTERHPRLVYCSISGYGSAGPYRDAKAYDLLIQAETGLVSITGTPDDPSKAGIPTADIAAGMYAFSGILAALYERNRTGRGRAMEISLFDSLAEWMGYPMYYTEYGGDAPVRSGASHAAIAPYGPFAAADGDVVLAIQNEREWLSFCTTVLCRPELATDVRFSSNSARVANRDALHAAVEAALGAQTVEQVTKRLAEAKIAYGRMNDITGLVHHPQLSSRNRWREVGSSVGPLQALLPPITYPGLEPRMDPIPAIGQDTAGVLGSLGYDAAEIERMQAEGTV
jgi:crotonobetainyl-CoA:carnitine CoA-transferase CaiB-like acyl-CoA transferase